MVDWMWSTGGRLRSSYQDWQHLAVSLHNFGMFGLDKTRIKFWHLLFRPVCFSLWTHINKELLSATWRYEYIFVMCLMRKKNGICVAGFVKLLLWHLFLVRFHFNIKAISSQNGFANRQQHSRDNVNICTRLNEPCAQFKSVNLQVWAILFQTFDFGIVMSLT